MDEAILKEAKRIVKRKKQFFHIAIPMSIVSIILLAVGFMTGEWLPPIIVISCYTITLFIAYLFIWNPFGKLKDKRKKIEAEAIAKEYFLLKDKQNEEISETEMLELKELERRYDDRDFV